MIKYKCKFFYENKISKHEIIEETKSKVTYVVKSKYMGNYKNTEKKESKFHTWVNSFGEAKNYILEKLIHEKKELNKRLDKIQTDIGFFSELTEKEL